jgi:hypothetical protein
MQLRRLLRLGRSLRTRLKPGLGTLALVFVFFVGAALAGGYTAVADVVSTVVSTDSSTDATASTGDSTSTLGESTDTTTTVAETTPESPPVDPTPTEPDPTPTDAGSTEPAPAPPPPDSNDPPPSSGSDDSGSEPGPVLHKKRHVRRAPETGEGAGAIVWLHRSLPDPTPPARRLAPSFARDLRITARNAHVSWGLVLAVLRARGHDGRVPATHARIERLAQRLATSRAAVVGTGEFRKEVRALARYNRAVGLRALVTGLEAAKPRLERRVLRDRRIDIYPGGRVDIALHRVDVRVLVLIRYLRVGFGQVSVTSLVSGHRFFARPGVVSAHVFGLAADISALHGVPIYGHQEPGGLTERAVERILRLPAEVQPQQVISLLGLGGASFPLADHYDHIHVGY